MAPRSRPQLDLPIPATWGGQRRGAGRKPTRERPERMHARRPVHEDRWPVHVTLRCAGGLPSLRSSRIFPPLRRAIGAANRADFRVVHFSVQVDHVHLLLEADGRAALARGAQGLAIRCALAINRTARRRGKVWAGRYHAHPLRSPNEARRALATCCSTSGSTCAPHPGSIPAAPGSGSTAGRARSPSGLRQRHGPSLRQRPGCSRRDGDAQADL
jgi:REP element-mobilizing transposase RayT